MIYLWCASGVLKVGEGGWVWTQVGEEDCFGVDDVEMDVNQSNIHQISNKIS